MGEQEAAENPNPNPSPKKPSSCEECGQNPWKYRCPGCSILTCSLPCVKSHKQRSSCTGKRNRTEFVPLSEFDDNVLISDYHLLVETKRVAESARRLLAGCRTRFGKLPTGLHMLRSAAHRRRTRVLFLPPDMSKSKQNQSRYVQRKNCIYWTIEWRFHSTDVILIDHGVDESVSLSSVIEKHLTPTPWNNKLTPFCNAQLKDLKFFIRKYAKGVSSPFRELNIEASIGEQLANVAIVEYPVIYVSLPSHSYDFTVEQYATLFSRSEKPPASSDGNSGPKGTFFREEEVEEGEMPPDTQVVDLMRCSGSEICDNIQHPKNLTKSEDADPMHCRSSEICDNVQYPSNLTKSKEAVYWSGQEMSPAVAEGFKPNSGDMQPPRVAEESNWCSNSVDAKKLSDDAEFEFEQELADAYSDLIGELNPDDFLCLDGLYCEEDESEKQREKTPGFGGELLEEEELEEGEIRS